MGKKSLLATLAVLLALIVMPVSAGGSPADPPGLEQAIAAQEAHSNALMARAGVVGTAVGLDSNDQPVVKIFTVSPGVPGLPSRLDGVPVEVEVTGMIMALSDPTTRFDRPVPTGVSTGHPDITAGTIGARVTNGQDVFALSNNHVYANTNDASIGDNVLQPGAFDGGVDPADAIGTLYDFEPINFFGGDNTMDAAIALSSTAWLGNATPSDGYGTPSSNTITNVGVGLAVKKYGRTTELTNGLVSEINVAVIVCYETQGPFRCKKSATFVDQIAIEGTPNPGDFSAGGDSGSLIVTQVGNNPVGLLFAGSSTRTIANRIGPVLIRFGVTIDDVAADAPPSVSVTNPANAADVSGTITISADASDDNGVAQVEFFVGVASIGVDTSYPYEVLWDTTTVVDGPYIVKATATDTLAQTTSDSINVSVDNTPPSVIITNPASDSTVSETIAITVNASDLTSGVTQVEFFVDGASIGVDTSDPYEVLWDTTTVINGNSMVTATATDGAGQTSSDTVTVTVDNPLPTTMHVSDLDGASANGSGPTWEAIITITLHDGSHANPVDSADVNITWSGVKGYAGGAASCLIVSGQCTVMTGDEIPKNNDLVTFTVSSVIGTLIYEPLDNHDPDGDSDGTSITISKP